MAWIERSVDRSPAMQRSRDRRIEQSKVIIDAARRLVTVKGSAFTLQELVKEAGVALNTIYRYFSGKDQLLLAVIEEMISESCQEYEQRSRHLPDPIERLRYYITTTLNPTSLGGDNAVGARFVTSEHWRLHRLYPEELAHATKPFTDLILREVVEATKSGVLRPSDPDTSAWLINQLVTAVFHHYAFAPNDGSREAMGERVWLFCLAALGGQPDQADRRRWMPGRRIRESGGQVRIPPDRS
jgi:AcrR family transcriptional regulator